MKQINQCDLCKSKEFDVNVKPQIVLYQFVKFRTRLIEISMICSQNNAKTASHLTNIGTPLNPT